MLNRNRMQSPVGRRSSAALASMAVALLALAAPPAWPQSAVTRLPLPDNSPFPISAGVWVGDTLYLSGMIDSSVAKGAPGDTQSQTIHVLDAIRHTLAEQHLSLGDVVLLHAFLAGDPAHGGRMDFAGFMAGYSRYFGTREQPSKPARSAMQVAALALPGALVEIEVVAVNTHSRLSMNARLGK